MRSSGFTLLEITVVVAIMSIVTGILFLLASSLHAAYRVQEGKVVTQDSTRNGMMLACRELRQAAVSTVTAESWPTTAISYRAAIDADGNGWPVDQNGALELSPVRTLGLDVNDANGDGKATDQLVLTEVGSSSVRVLANDLVPGTGATFEVVRGALRITLRSVVETASEGASHKLVTTLVETVMPRN